jgi:hypothetical protein
MPGQFVTASVATIDAALEELRAHDYLNFRNWDEYGDKARALQSEAVTALAAHRENAVAREALQAERDARAAEDAKRAADAAVQERITVITTAPMSVFGKPAADIKRLLDRLNKTDVATFGEHSVQAAGALSQAVQMVGMMLSQAEAAEAKEAELARLQAEEAQRAAAAEQAKRDEEAALQARENAARLEAERLEREVAEAAAREQQQKAQAEADASQARVRAMSARRQRLEDQAEVMHGILASARDVLAQAGRADLVESIDEVFAAIEGA